MLVTRRGVVTIVLALVSLFLLAIGLQDPGVAGAQVPSTSPMSTMEVDLQRAEAASAQPPPTSTPSQPGIAIAKAGFDLPDPDLLDANGTYYLYLSSAFGNPLPQHIPLLIGSPGHWSATSVDAVPTFPSWANPDTTVAGSAWMPSVHKLGSTYVMYFDPMVKYSLPVQRCVAVATSTNPAGPFRVSAKPLVCQRASGGDIDAELFVDPDGPDGPSNPNYLIWKTDNNSTPGDGTPGIWAQPLSNDGQTLVGQPVEIYKPDQPWEMSLVEAPQMALSPVNSSVWLFFSGGQGYFSPNYAMGVAHCASVFGPCTDQTDSPLLASNGQGSGPGEETYFTGSDGSDWLLYSPIHTGTLELARPVEATRIGWNASGPYVAEAGAFPEP